MPTSGLNEEQGTKKMSPELLLVAKFAVVFFLAMLAIFWLSLPFAVWAIKSRMEAARVQRDEVLQELFWLRKTIETIPGAKGVARRKSQQKLNKIEKDADEATADSEQEAEADGKQKSKAKKKAGKKAGKKVGGSKSAEKPVRKEPTVTGGKPAKEPKEPDDIKSLAKRAASLTGDDGFGDEDLEDEDEYDEEFQNGAGDRAETKSGEYADDEEDYEDDSLDFLDAAEDPSSKMIDVPLTGQSAAKKKAQAMAQRIIVDLPEEDEIEEDKEGYFIYRGERFENLIDAMRQQQDDAQAERAKKAAKG